MIKNDSLFLFPLIIEKKLFLKNFNSISEKCYLGGKGKVDFALNTQNLISKYRPQFIFSFGSCGLINQNTSFKVGDLVLIKEVIEHDFKDKFINEGKMPTFLLDSAENKLIDFIPKVICASGDEDLISLEDRSRIYKMTQADVVTWESAGFARVKKLHKKNQSKFIDLRIITDDGSSVLDKNTFVKNFEIGLEKMKEVLRKLEIIS